MFSSLILIFLVIQNILFLRGNRSSLIKEPKTPQNYLKCISQAVLLRISPFLLQRVQINILKFSFSSECLGAHLHCLHFLIYVKNIGFRIVRAILLQILRSKHLRNHKNVPEFSVIFTDFISKGDERYSPIYPKFTKQAMLCKLKIVSQSRDFISSMAGIPSRLQQPSFPILFCSPRRVGLIWNLQQFN